MTLPGYSATAEVDRIDPHKGYVRGNIQWATRKEQTRNKRQHSRLESGELLVEAIERLGAMKHKAVIRYWFRAGTIRTEADIITIQQRNEARFKPGDEIAAIQSVRPDYGYEAIRAKLKAGMTKDEIINHKKWGGCGGKRTKKGL